MPHQPAGFSIRWWNHVSFVSFVFLIWTPNLFEYQQSYEGLIWCMNYIWNSEIWMAPKIETVFSYWDVLWMTIPSLMTSWWRHQMETFSALLVTGEFPAQRPVTRSFDVFFNDWLNSFIRSSLTQHMVKYTQIKIIYIKHRNRSMCTQNKDRITRIKQ